MVTKNWNGFRYDPIPGQNDHIPGQSDPERSLASTDSFPVQSDPDVFVIEYKIGLPVCVVTCGEGLFSSNFLKYLAKFGFGSFARLYYFKIHLLVVILPYFCRINHRGVGESQFSPIG